MMYDAEGFRAFKHSSHYRWQVAELARIRAHVPSLRLCLIAQRHIREEHFIARRNGALQQSSTEIKPKIRRRVGAVVDPCKNQVIACEDHL